MIGLVFASALLASGQTSAPEKPATATVQKPLQQRLEDRLQQQLKDALRARRVCEGTLAEWDQWRANNWNDEKNMTKGELTLTDEIQKLTKEYETVWTNCGASAAGGGTREGSVKIGATTLRLGMPKATVLSALGFEYDVKPVSPPNLPPSRSVYAILNKSATVGFVRFDDEELLVAAERNWMAESRQYSEEEIGRTLVALIATLSNGGQSACRIDASVTGTSGDAAVAQRKATIECNGKRLLIQVLTPPNGRGELNVVEQIEGK